MSEASVQTYAQQVRSGKIDSDEETIRKYLKYKDGITYLYLRDSLGMPEKTLSARLSDLKDKGEIYYEGKEKTLFNTCSIIKYEKDPHFQKMRSRILKVEKFNKKLRSVMKDSLCNSRLKDLLENEKI